MLVEVLDTLLTGGQTLLGNPRRRPPLTRISVSCSAGTRITTATLQKIGYFAKSGSDLRMGLRSPPISAMPVEYLMHQPWLGVPVAFGDG